MASITNQIKISVDKNPLAALEEALEIIEGYQLDIKNAEETIGINLIDKGFCQGTYYKQTADRIKRKLESKT